MDALISGRAGAAIVVAGSKVALLHSGATGDILRTEPANVQFVMADVDDLQALEIVDIQDVQHDLGRVRGREEALHLVLILLDSDLSEGVRQEAAAALESLLTQSDLGRELKTVLFAQSLPASADLRGAIAGCRSASATTTKDLVQALEAFQPLIRVARRQWDAIPTATFGSDEARVHFRSVAVNEGLFLDLVATSGHEREIDQLLSRTVLNASVAVLPNHRAVLEEWARAFQNERGSALRVLFLSEDEELVDDLALGLRLTWPDLEPLTAVLTDVGLHMIREHAPDLVFLCGDLPDMGLLEAIREIRHFSDIPIIAVQKGVDELEVVKAIKLGADDHINVPCIPMVVNARVIALMRRVVAVRPQYLGALLVGDLVVDPSNYEAFLGSSRLFLTPTEFKLLHFLVTNRHATMTEEMIQVEIWGGAADAGTTLKKYIQRLRRILGDDARDPKWIHTVHGVGYRFTVPAATRGTTRGPSRSAALSDPDPGFR